MWMEDEMSFSDGLFSRAFAVLQYTQVSGGEGLFSFLVESIPIISPT